MSNNKNEIIKITNEHSLANYKHDFNNIVEFLYRILKVIIILCILILLIKERKFLSIFMSGSDIVMTIAIGFGFFSFVGQQLYDEVCQLFSECRIDKWDGFSGKNPHGVYDGSMMNFMATLTERGGEAKASPNRAP